MRLDRVAALLGLPPAGLAQTQPTDVTVVRGACQPQSALTEDGRKTPFDCDSAVFAFFDLQNSHIMIQFAKKGDDHVPMLGFAGTMEKDGQTLDIDRIYLEPGKPQAAEQASCKLTFEAPHITGVDCDVQAALQKASAKVVFKAAPGQ